MELSFDSKTMMNAGSACNSEVCIMGWIDLIACPPFGFLEDQSLIWISLVCRLSVLLKFYSFCNRPSLCIALSRAPCRLVCNDAHVFSADSFDDQDPDPLGLLPQAS